MKIEEAHLVGSTYILGEGADIDVLVLTAMPLQEAIRIAEEEDFTPDVDEVYTDAPFLSMRNGDVNLILTEDDGLVHRFVAAARVCRLLKVQDKDLRIALHQIIRDGFDPYDDSLISL